MDASDPATITPADDELDLLLRQAKPEPLQVLVSRWRSIESSRRRWITGAVAVVGLIAGGWMMLGRAGTTPVELPMTEPDAAAVSGPPTAPGTTAGAGLVVHVAGAVVSPGVVHLSAGTRVADALAAAGGLRAEADLERINLAAPLNDGSRLYVPAIGQQIIPQPVAGAGAASGSSAGSVGAPVDLNSATEAQLDGLPGVGPATAAAIVAYRDSNGRFVSVDELDEVRGIGPARLEQLRDLVVVS